MKLIFLFVCICCFNLVFGDSDDFSIDKMGTLNLWKAKLYEKANQKGASMIASGTISECINLDKETLHEHKKDEHVIITANKELSSVNTNGNCIRLYEQLNCTGNYAEIKPGSSCHSDFNQCKHDDQTSSVSGCIFIRSNKKCEDFIPINSISKVSGENAEYLFFKNAYELLEGTILHSFEMAVNESLQEPESEIYSDEDEDETIDWSSIEELNINQTGKAGYEEAIENTFQLLVDKESVRRTGYWSRNWCSKLKTAIILAENVCEYRQIQLETHKALLKSTECYKYHKAVQQIWTDHSNYLKNLHQKHC